RARIPEPLVRQPARDVEAHSDRLGVTGPTALPGSTVQGPRAGRIGSATVPEEVADVIDDLGELLTGGHAERSAEHLQEQPETGRGARERHNLDSWNVR